MSKRRTRKQKQEAKHTFTISWEPGNKEIGADSSVKRQFRKGSKAPKSQDSQNKLSENTVKDMDLASIKKDIAKSLILASFILASEIVLYLIL